MYKITPQVCLQYILMAKRDIIQLFIVKRKLSSRLDQRELWLLSKSDSHTNTFVIYDRFINCSWIILMVFYNIVYERFVRLSFNNIESRACHYSCFWSVSLRPWVILVISLSVFRFVAVLKRFIKCNKRRKVDLFPLFY